MLFRSVFWDDHRLLAIGGLAAFYLVVSALLLLAARNRGAATPRPFAATLGELKKDHEDLTR